MEKIMQFLPVNIAKLEKNKDAAGLNKAMLTHKDAGTKEKAAYALGRLKDEAVQDTAVEYLSAAVKDTFEDERVRCAAAMALGNFKRRDVEKVLIDAVSDEYENVRLSALQSLADFRTVESITALLRKIDDPSAKVKNMTGAVLGLGNESMAQMFRDALYSDNEMVRTKASKELGASKNRKIVDILLIMLNTDSDALRKKVIQILGYFDSDQIFEPLVSRLDSESGDNLVGLYTTLAKIKSDRVIDVLIKALDSSNASIRMLSAQSLAERRSDKAMDRLLAILTNPQEYAELRAVVAKGLGRMKSIPVLEALVGSIENSGDTLRTRIEDSLVEMNHPELLGQLGRLAASSNWQVRFSLVKILMKLKRTGSSELLLPLLSDPNQEVVNIVIMALGDLKEPGVTEALVAVLEDHQRTSQIRGGAARGLGRLAEERALYPLFEAIRDSDEAVRGSAALGLGGFKNPEVIEVLGNALQDSSEMVRAMVVEAMGQIKDVKTVEYLKRAQNDPSDKVRNTAMRVLSGIK